MAKEVAAELNYSFLDLQSELNGYILKTSNISLIIADEILKETETELVKASINKRDSVIFMPNDMFLSNQNYRYVKGISFAICEQKTSPIKQNLQKLICAHCKYIVDSKNAKQKIMQIIANL